MISFHLPIVPPKATSQTAGRRMFIPKDGEGRVTGRPMFFKNKKAKSAESDLTLLCSPHRPASPIDGPVCLSVDFVFPWRASEPQKRRRLGRVPMTKKPDCSNLIKQIEDVLTKLCFWTDDGQVADLRVTKAWGDKVGITVQVAPLEGSESPILNPAPEQGVLL